MDLKYSGLALFVKDIDKAKNFYSNILKLSIQFDFGKNIVYQGGMAIWEINAQHIIPALLGEKSLTDTKSNRVELYFETEDLEGIYSSLKDCGTNFLHDIHEEPWGQRTIRFFDPDNHLIEVGESLKQFVSRFYKSGMSFVEVSARTSMPVEEVKRLIEG